MHYGENCNRSWLNAEENCEGKPPNPGTADVVEPCGIRFWVGPDTRPTRLDFSEELQPEPTPLKLVPEELGLQFKLGTAGDA